MSLIEYDLLKRKWINKIEIAIDRLRFHQPPEGYFLAFSGGKDSIVIKKLAEISGVKYEAVYNVTTIDPPELIYFIKKHHPDVKWERPEKPLLKVIEKRGFPMRQSRWCCEKYKEGGGKGRWVITGVRWEESNKRKQRKMVEACMKDKTKIFMNVIIDWLGIEVWEFIEKYKLPYCELYDKGFKRIGCLFCPSSYYKNRQREAMLYPRYRRLFIKAFEKLYENRKKSGAESVDRWKSGEEMFKWWIGKESQRENPDQRVMFE